jgi:hypothetical protein
MSGAGNLDDPRRRNARSHVVRYFPRYELVLGATQDERRHAHGRQDVPHVDLLVHAVERLDCARARSEANHLEECVRLLVGEVAECLYGLTRLLARAERLQRTLDVALVFVFAAAPWIIVRPHAAWKRAAHDERSRSGWIRRGEQDAHRRPLGEAIERRASRAGCVHDRADVVHARLERRGAFDTVRHPGAALVEPNQS